MGFNLEIRPQKNDQTKPQEEKNPFNGEVLQRHADNFSVNRVIRDTFGEEKDKSAAAGPVDPLSVT